MYSSFLALAIETKKGKEMDFVSQTGGAREADITWTAIIFRLFLWFTHESMQTCFLVERNCTSTIIIRKDAPFPVASTLSKLDVYYLSKDIHVPGHWFLKNCFQKWYTNPSLWSLHKESSSNVSQHIWLTQATTGPLLTLWPVFMLN